MPEDSAGEQLALDFYLAQAAAREAGTLALAYFHAGPRTWTKGDDSPVSEADIAVDGLLRRRLGAARPGYGWISEEVEDTPARLDKTKVWVVDPIDGTRAFLKHNAQWVISVALVEAGSPSLGLIYNPMTQEMFSAIKGQGAFLNDQPIRVAGRAEIENAKVIASSTAMSDSGWRQPWPRLHRTYVNSLAYRVALVAAGQVDATLVFSRFHEWDVAAVDIILTEAGGNLTDIDGQTVGYNKPSLRLPSCVAANPGLHRKLVEFIAANRIG